MSSNIGLVVNPKTGFVGIGTAMPTSQFHVHGPTFLTSVHMGEMAGPILPSESNAFSVGSSNNRFLDAYFSRAVDISGVAISPDATGSGIKVTSAATGALVNVTASYIQASNIRSIGDVQAVDLIADYVLGSNIRSVGDVQAVEVIADYVLGSNIRSVGDVQAAYVLGSNIRSLGDVQANFVLGSNIRSVGDVQANFVLGSNIRSVGDVQAQNITASGLLTASNIRVLGDYVILDTITSNTEQMVITNDGTGPALKVTQTGANSIAEFYDGDGGSVLALKIANDGLVGIGTATPQAKLHVVGSALVSSNLNVTGNLVPTAVNLVGTGDTSTAATHYFVETGSDGFVRPKTLANAKAELVTTASVNSAAATTVGTITSGVWNAGAVTSSSTVSAGTQVLAPSGDVVGTPGFSWTGNTGTGIYRPATNTVAIVTNSTERVRVDASGNVGINTSFMIDKLCISSSGINDYHGIRFYEAGSDYGGFLKYHNGDDRLTLGTTNAAVDINAINIARSTGNVGIGTATPLSKLDVNGSIRNKNSAFHAYRNSATSTNSRIVFDIPVTNIGSNYNTTTGVYTAPMNGTYMFNACAMKGAENTQYFHIYIRKNGGMLSFVHGSTSSYEGGSCSVIAELVPGDQIDVFIPNTYAATSPGAGTFFNGYMIG